MGHNKDKMRTVDKNETKVGILTLATSTRFFDAIRNPYYNVVLSERASVDRPRPLESPLPLNVLLLCMPAMHVYIRVGGYRVTTQTGRVEMR